MKTKETKRQAKKPVKRSETKSTSQKSAKKSASSTKTKTTSTRTSRGNHTSKAQANTQAKTKKDEFRVNKKTGHPNYIYYKVGNRYKCIGLTHSNITQGVKNIKLEKNPDPKDKKEAYLRPQTKSEKTKSFKGKKEGWKLSKNDKKTVNKIIKSNKKRTT